eukprot:GDKJ01058845.1.p1 GENE.GDKJ01058845.1~~GDKJ01058845.1.p1  ORF type:complete len:433 (+),score=91.44 GDKJ01058845.1:29-1327(+)
MLCKPRLRASCQARFFSKFRVNICSNEWVAITGAHRRNRPQQTPIKTQPKRELKSSQADCPFCPHNQDTLTDVLLEFHAKDFSSSENQILRVVRNKYPVVNPTNSDFENNFYSLGYRDTEPVDILQNGEMQERASFDAFGYHEVVIEHDRHEITLNDMSATYWEMLFRAFRDRGRVLSRDIEIKSIHCFKNVGPFGGASLFHPHSQIVALPVVPSQQFKSHKTAHRYYSQKCKCLFCYYAESEIAARERVVEITKDFVVVVPFAAHIPFHLMVIPRHHNYSFEEESNEMISKLGRVLRRTFKRLDIKLNNPDFNLILRNSHHAEPSYKNISIKDYYHWHLEIFPRLDSWPVAGFEFGTGILCNSHPPEEDAKLLREVEFDAGDEIPESDKCEPLEKTSKFVGDNNGMFKEVDDHQLKSDYSSLYPRALYAYL